MYACVCARLRGSEGAKVKSLEDRKLATPEDLRKKPLEALRVAQGTTACLCNSLRLEEYNILANVPMLNIPSPEAQASHFFLYNKAKKKSKNPEQQLNR